MGEIAKGAADVKAARETKLALALGRLGLIAILHGVLEAANAFAEALAEFGQFLGTKHQQRDAENHEQVHRLKQTIKHKSSVFQTRTGQQGCS
jgi:hypothetical protein